MRVQNHQTYVQQRKLLLIELRLMRLTAPARRVVKHMQTQMRKLRTMRNMGAFDG